VNDTAPRGKSRKYCVKISGRSHIRISFSPPIEAAAKPEANELALAATVNTMTCTSRKGGQDPESKVCARVYKVSGWRELSFGTNLPCQERLLLPARQL
jgi:hypothetical protein